MTDLERWKLEECEEGKTYQGHHIQGQCGKCNAHFFIEQADILITRKLKNAALIQFLRICPVCDFCLEPIPRLILYFEPIDVTIEFATLPKKSV